MAMFFMPYFMACYSAGYAILQTLDGLGIASTNFLEFNVQGQLVNSYFSPSEAALGFTAMVLLFFVFLLPMTLLSSWILSKKKGMIICLFIILLPGVLSTLGWFPHIQWLPLRYELDGAGNTGHATGMGVLVFLALLLGWVSTIIISDLFFTGEKFRQWTDVFLILTALTSGVFWVSDREIASEKKDYSETINEINGAAQYLLHQTKDYSRMCIDNRITDTASCQWASYVQERLENIASQKSSVVEYLIPANNADFYHIGAEKPETANAIRKELNDYNKKSCPSIEISNSSTRIPLPSYLCQEPPPAYCNAIQTGEYKTEMWGRYAIANECVTSAIIMYRDSMKIKERRLALSKMNPHYRWMWFVLLSFSLGVKIANVMTKIYRIDCREESERRKIKKLVYSSGVSLGNAAVHYYKMMWSLVSTLYFKAKRIFCEYIGHDDS